MKKVCLELLNGKKINLNLYEEYAPITVANFLHLVDIHFYDGLIFHRIIKDFMSQGGAYYVEATENDGELKERNVGYTIPGEFNSNNFENNIMHTAGVISMARTSEPNSASSQFFICDADCEFLNNEYAAFGIVADEESMNVVHELSALPTFQLNEGFANFPSVDVADFMIKTIYKVEA